MTLLPRLLARKRLILSVAVLLSFTGFSAWLTMPRQEDPQFPERNGIVIVSFPGADAEMVERLVVEPIEERLAEVQEVREVRSTARAGVAIVDVELLDEMYDTDRGWDEVTDALGRASADFPDGVATPTLDHELITTEAIVLAVRGSVDPLVLVKAAKRVKRELLRLDPVKKVKIIGDPGEQITVEYDGATARRLGVDPRLLAATLSQRTTIVPGGTIRLGDRSASLRPHTDISSMEELSRTSIVLPSGAAVPLEAVARVRRGAAEPPREMMHLDGERVIGLGVMAKDGIDLVVAGQIVRDRVAELRLAIEPLEIIEVMFQPDHVDERLSGLSRSLMIGILIVASVLFAVMGLRLGTLVAVIVPLVTFTSVALFSLGGGILHQISIAALVIALGMLVDNAIVVAEAIQSRLDAGIPPRQASCDTVRELALPLGAATGTTLAAFVPMFISKGATADFTRAIPVLIMLTLTMSYLFAVLVTPVLAELLLRPRRDGDRGARTADWAERIAGLTTKRPLAVLAGLAAVMAITAMAGGLVDQQFFPAADRATVVVELELPEGSHIEETKVVVRELEEAMLDRDDVRTVSSYIGRAAPHFYYNLLNRPSSPHRADLVVETTDLDAVGAVMAWTREYASMTHPQAQVVARRLEQGPPIGAPVEVRVKGHDIQHLEVAADEILGALRCIEGTRDVRHDLGLGQPTVSFSIDDAAAGRHGVSRVDVALALLGRTRGLEVGQYRSDDDPVPIVVRSSAGERFPVGDLAAVDVGLPGGQPTPLGQVARIEPEWRPAAIQHRNGRRTVTVSAQLADGATSPAILEAFAARQADLDLPADVALELGGELEESGQANTAILRAAPIGLLMLIFFLLMEFDSFRRVGIIFVTVPLAGVGVIPGLLLSGQPFGFMSLLGVVALVGIVVNNAIVLLDVVERERSRGADVESALRTAISERLRPILLTMVTTVAGLTPLAMSPTSLWPPLAWAMISGLAASTFLTLLAVPALYTLLFRSRPRPRPAAKAAAVAAALVVLIATAPPVVRAADAARVVRAADAARITTVTLEEAMTMAASRPAAQAERERARAVALGAQAIRRSGLLPSLNLGGDSTWRDKNIRIETPVGPFELGELHSTLFAVEVRQPLFEPAIQLYRAPAAKIEAEAAHQVAERSVENLVAEGAGRFFDVLRVDARIESTEGFVDALTARLEETEARVGSGRALEADSLKLQLDLESAALDLFALRQAREIALRNLGRAAGTDTPLDVDWDGRWDRPGNPQIETLVDAAFAARRDLEALLGRATVARLEAEAIGAEGLPRLEARGRHISTDGDPFLPQSSTEVSINLAWNPLAGFTRRPRAEAALAEAGALEAEILEARRGIAVEVQGAVSFLATARRAVEVGDRRVELASETVRVERQRFAAGRVTTNDLLDAETVLRESRQLASIARIEVLAAWVELDLAVGSLSP